MVVTGVRFVKKKGVIHLEIEQAPATEEGKFVQTQSLFKKRFLIEITFCSLVWSGIVIVKRISPFFLGTVNDEQRRWLPANDFSVDNPEMREDKDYMTMKYEERSMDTDKVINFLISFD